MAILSWSNPCAQTSSVSPSLTTPLFTYYLLPIPTPMFSLLLSGLLTLVSLNCENLFDCQQDSMKDDWEWTPEGSNRWTPFRYCKN